VIQPSPDQFLQACGATGPLRLSVERPGERGSAQSEFAQPFVLVGRETWADLALNDPEVSRRHAYLQVIDGRLFCLDLDSRAGTLWDGRSRKSGWLAPDHPAGIGPFAVRPSDGPGSLSGLPDWDPLASRAPDRDPLPAVGLEVVVGTQKGLVWRMNRVLALVGQSPGCKVRVGDWGVGQYHCALLRTALGLWVIDLMASGGSSVNRTPVRYARLDHGDELLVGDTLFGVRYESGSSPALPTTAAVAAPTPVEPVAAEADPRGEELAAARAEAEVLRAELDAVRGQLDQARADVEAARTVPPAADPSDALRAELEAARAEAERLRAEFEREREEARAGQEAARREADDLRAERDRLDKAAGEARAELDWARAEADSLRRDREDSKGLRAQLEAAQVEAAVSKARVGELEGWADEVHTLRTELGTARAQADAAAKLGADLEAARAAAAEAEVQRARVEEL
jgi:pSer/pThr/pTyr-binding forkhead associated (FHA) protein